MKKNALLMCGALVAIAIVIGGCLIYLFFMNRLDTEPIPVVDEIDILDDTPEPTF